MTASLCYPPAQAPENTPARLRTRSCSDQALYTYLQIPPNQRLAEIEVRTFKVCFPYSRTTPKTNAAAPTHRGRFARGGGFVKAPSCAALWLLSGRIESSPPEGNKAINSCPKRQLATTIFAAPEAPFQWKLNQKTPRFGGVWFRYLLCIFDGFGLPKHVNLDLSGICQLAFNLLGDIPRQQNHFIL